MPKKPKEKKGKKSRKRKPKVQSDKNGDFIWETYFVGGKQKRRKIRTIGGEVVQDLDEWLLRNADDIFLHQYGDYALIHQREQENMNLPEKKELPIRSVTLKIFDIESAFESLPDDEFLSYGDFDDPLQLPFIDLRTGDIIYIDGEDDDRVADPEFLAIDQAIDDHIEHWDLETFVDQLEDSELRNRLSKTIQGKGAFRRFKDIVFGGGDVELKYAWNWYQTRKQREQIVEWMKSNRIDPQWDCDIFEKPTLPSKRPELLRAVLDFVTMVGGSPGVRRIALLGSLTTEKAIPKDVDLLVEVDDGADLKLLARAKRQLMGKTMATGDSCGADVFFCDPDKNYLGRSCSWKRCEPGIRQSCEALHCGRRQFLYDDLHIVKLERILLESPPVDLWPTVVERIELPGDVVERLVNLLRSREGGA